MAGFTHFDNEGKARMVDVSDKAETERTATAKGSVIMQPATLALIKEGGVKKGDVLSRRAARRHHGRQADAGPDPFVPSPRPHLGAGRPHRWTRRAMRSTSPRPAS